MFHAKKNINFFGAYMVIGQKAFLLYEFIKFDFLQRIDYFPSDFHLSFSNLSGFMRPTGFGAHFKEIIA